MPASGERDDLVHPLEPLRPVRDQEQRPVARSVEDLVQQPLR
jgi:hypothetical protein